MKSIRASAAVMCLALAIAACTHDFSVFEQSAGDDGGPPSDATKPSYRPPPHTALCAPSAVDVISNTVRV